LRTVAIVQARMGSTRLPGKVLMDIGGQSVLQRVVRRLARALLVTQTVVATTTSPADDAVVAEAERLEAGFFRGSEHDVLGRYLGAANVFSADVVVRITSDCPLMDPEVTDEVIHAFFTNQADFAFSDVTGGFPRGLDVEVCSVEALRTAAQFADSPYQREHVTPIFYERSDLFRTSRIRAERDFSHYRWTLDTPEDLCLIRAIYSQFSNREHFTWREVADLMERSPELSNINSHVVQKSAYEVAPAAS